MKTIAETIMADGSLQSMANVMKSTGMTEKLSGDGPFTMFVPDDEAFAKVNLAEVLHDAKKQAEILRYHVLEGKYTANDVMAMEHASTMEIKSLTIRVKYGDILIDNGKIIKADIECSNGIIHVVNAIFLPWLAGWYGDCGCC